MIRREIGKFLIVGGLTVLIDLAVYRGLVRLAGTDVDLAKGIGFLAGTVFAYFANRLWTFGQRPHAPGSAWRFAILYGATLGANVLVNAAVLAILSETPVSVEAAFLAATGVSATLNFLGMKFFVFKTKPDPELI